MSQLKKLQYRLNARTRRSFSHPQYVLTCHEILLRIFLGIRIRAELYIFVNPSEHQYGMRNDMTSVSTNLRYRPNAWPVAPSSLANCLLVAHTLCCTQRTCLSSTSSQFFSSNWNHKSWPVSCFTHFLKCNS